VFLDKYVRILMKVRTYFWRCSYSVCNYLFTNMFYRAF